MKPTPPNAPDATHAARPVTAPNPGPTLVMLHGANGTAATFTPTLGAWPWAHVICPDLPGRGHTPGPALDRTEALADWLAALAADRGWGPLILVGHSLGGAVALQVALRHPDLLAGVALVSSSGRLRVAPAILGAVAASTPDAPLDMGFAFGPDASNALKARYADLARPIPTATALADWRACDCFDVLGQLGDVRCPVLVVHGDRDVLTPPKHQRKLAQALPNATHVELQGPGHMLPWEAPEALSKAVETWWAGLSEASQPA